MMKRALLALRNGLRRAWLSPFVELVALIAVGWLNEGAFDAWCEGRARLRAGWTRGRPAPAALAHFYRLLAQARREPLPPALARLRADALRRLHQSLYPWFPPEGDHNETQLSAAAE